MSACRIVLCSLLAVTCGQRFCYSAEPGRDRHELQSRDNLKRIGLAFHNYHQRHETLPGFAGVDTNGNPLLSWRVQLLPYLGKSAASLHKEVRLDEPWDSEHNLKLLPRMPEVFLSPMKAPLPPGMTCYVVPRGKLTLFPANQGGNIWRVPFGDVYQGLANIILVVEADRDIAVPWTKPVDLNFDRRKPMQNLGHMRERGFLCCWASGQVSLVPNSFQRQRTDRTEFLSGLFERKNESRGIAYFFGLK